MTDEEQTFRCATCDAVRPIEDLPRVTLTVCAGMTAVPFTQLMCKLCASILAKYLHDNYCPTGCDEEHEELG